MRFKFVVVCAALFLMVMVLRGIAGNAIPPNQLLDKGNLQSMHLKIQFKLIKTFIQIKI